MYAINRDKLIRSIKSKKIWNTKEILSLIDKISAEIPDEDIKTFRESFWCESCNFECDDICKMSQILEKLI